MSTSLTSWCDSHLLPDLFPGASYLGKEIRLVFRNACFKNECRLFVLYYPLAVYEIFFFLFTNALIPDRFSEVKLACSKISGVLCRSLFKAKY